MKGLNDFWKIIQRARALSRSILLAPVILSDGLNAGLHVVCCAVASIAADPVEDHLLSSSRFITKVIMTLKNFHPGV